MHHIHTSWSCWCVTYQPHNLGWSRGNAPYWNMLYCCCTPKATAHPAKISYPELTAGGLCILNVPDVIICYSRKWQFLQWKLSFQPWASSGEPTYQAHCLTWTEHFVWDLKKSVFTLLSASEMSNGATWPFWSSSFYPSAAHSKWAHQCAQVLWAQLLILRRVLASAYSPVWEPLRIQYFSAAEAGTRMLLQSLALIIPVLQNCLLKILFML